MAEQALKVMGWGTIVAIMVVTSLVFGVTIGLLGETMGLSGGGRTAGVGAAVGVIGALLISRRRAALATASAPTPSAPP